MLKKTSTSTYLVTALVVASMAVGCSSDDTAAPSPVAGAGGQATSGGGAGRAGSGGSGGSTGGAGGATGGSSAGTSGAGGGDASSMDSGGAQAETAVILIDNMVVMRKPASDAGGSEAGAASDAAVTDAAAPSDAAVQPVTYTFDSDIQGWHYTPFGSSPNIGFGDPGDAGGIKLSDLSRSQLAFDSTHDADGRVDASGALMATVGFRAANEQIDAQAFSVTPNDATQWKVWSGFIATARIRLISGGNLNRTCPLRATIYITSGAGYATGISPPINLTTAATDWTTVTYDFDTIVPGPTAPNLTQVNQLGIQIGTGTCP